MRAGSQAGRGPSINPGRRVGASGPRHRADQLGFDSDLRRPLAVSSSTRTVLPCLLGRTVTDLILGVGLTTGQRGNTHWLRGAPSRLCPQATLAMSGHSCGPHNWDAARLPTAPQTSRVPGGRPWAPPAVDTQVKRGPVLLTADTSELCDAVLALTTGRSHRSGESDKSNPPCSHGP